MRIIALLIALFLAGCSSSAPEVPTIEVVQGKVLLPQGKPLKGGRLMLRREGGLNKPLIANIDEDGTFEMNDDPSCPVLEGNYDVYLIFNHTPEERKLARYVPEKYRDLGDEDSDLRVALRNDNEKIIVKLKKS
jgi:PBP1b-binding outer membrane lipoprotein LpoB